MAVRLYPDVPRRRNAAIAGDVAVVALLVVFAWLGFRVHDSVARLAGLGRGVQSAGASVQGAFRQAGDDAERRRLLATRAAFHLPFGTLLRHTRDPLGDLAAGRHDALVAAELEDAGLLDRSAPRRSG